MTALASPDDGPRRFPRAIQACRASSDASGQRSARALEAPALGSALVFLSLAFLALAIGQSILRRRANPYAEIAYAQVPDPVRSEIERLLPGFAPARSTMTKRRDEARIEGDPRDEGVRVEADLDRDGSLVELEVDTRRRARMTGVAGPGEMLPDTVGRELDRVIGPEHASFEISHVRVGTLPDGASVYEVNGRSADWKWEIGISTDGRLIELEKGHRWRRH